MGREGKADLMFMVVGWVRWGGGVGGDEDFRWDFNT